MTYQAKRRATEDEIRRACTLKHIDPDQVAEAWIDCADVVEIVMLDFVERHTVNVKESA